MKTPFFPLIVAGLLGSQASLFADIFYQGTDPTGGGGTAVGSLINTAVPVGNTAGMFDTMDLSLANLGNIASLTVSLNYTLNGGPVNSDLYAYLSYGSQAVTLLDRIGLSSANAFGQGGTGNSVITLSDLGTANIHSLTDGGTLAGTYQADGQTVSPISLAAAFSANGGAETLNGTYGGMNPNGQWTLYLADVVNPGTATPSATLNGWSLNIMTVPEPSSLTLGILGILVVGGVFRMRQVRSAGGLQNNG